MAPKVNRDPTRSRNNKRLRTPGQELGHLSKEKGPGRERKGYLKEKGRRDTHRRPVRKRERTGPKRGGVLMDQR